MTTPRELALQCRTHLLEALANLGAMNRDVTLSQLRSEYSKRHPELTKAHLYEQFGYKCIIKILRDFLRKDVHVTRAPIGNDYCIRMIRPLQDAIHDTTGLPYPIGQLVRIGGGRAGAVDADEADED